MDKDEILQHRNLFEVLILNYLSKLKIYRHISPPPPPRFDVCNQRRNVIENYSPRCCEGLTGVLQIPPTGFRETSAQSPKINSSSEGIPTSAAQFCCNHGQRFRFFYRTENKELI